jgi:hypothetical protein
MATLQRDPSLYRCTTYDACTLRGGALYHFAWCIAAVDSVYHHSRVSVAARVARQTHDPVSSPLNIVC